MRNLERKIEYFFLSLIINFLMKFRRQPFNFKEALQKGKVTCFMNNDDREKDAIILGTNAVFVGLNDDPDVYIAAGIKYEYIFLKKLVLSLIRNKPFVIVEDGFLKNMANRRNMSEAIDRFSVNNCYTADDITHYIDATVPSRLELMLNSDEISITEEQKESSRRLISKIIGNKLTKYNSQPIYTPNTGRAGRKKVLVVDQAYNDMSIIKGMADDKTFEQMLKAAIAENPDADIIIKTHPDSIVKKPARKAYYAKVRESENIFKVTYQINPISMLEYVDKVYVCTTQLGLEALMCGKEVHTFGMPFYAGWGLTNDRVKLARKSKKRSLEELFYITYILYPIYINPETGTLCKIEDTLETLLKLREEYFVLTNIMED